MDQSHPASQDAHVLNAGRNDMPSQRKAKSFLTDAILLSLVTAEFYAVAFAHESGYLSFYHIPTHFIQPTITTLALSGLGCLMAVLSTLKAISLLTPLLERAHSSKSSAHQSIYALNIILLIASVFIIVRYPWAWLLFWTCVCIILVFNVVYFGLPLLFSKLAKSKKSAKEVLEDALTENDPFDLNHWLMSKGYISRSHFGGILLLVLLIGMGWVVGNSAAMRESNHDVIGDKRDVIVLRSYNDVLLCKPFDPQTQTFANDYIVRKIGYDEILATRTNTGRLSLRKNNNTHLNPNATNVPTEPMIIDALPPHGNSDSTSSITSGDTHSTSDCSSVAGSLILDNIATSSVLSTATSTIVTAEIVTNSSMADSNIAEQGGGGYVSPAGSPSPHR